MALFLMTTEPPKAPVPQYRDPTLPASLSPLIPMPIAGRHEGCAASLGGGVSLPITVRFSTTISRSLLDPFNICGDKIQPNPELPAEMQSRNEILLSIMQWLSGSRSTPAQTTNKSGVRQVKDKEDEFVSGCGYLPSAASHQYC